MSKRIKTNYNHIYCSYCNAWSNEVMCNCGRDHVKKYSKEEVRDKFKELKENNFKNIAQCYSDLDECTIRHFQESDLIYWRREFCKATNPYLWKRVQNEKDNLSIYDLQDVADFEHKLKYSETITNEGYCLAVLSFTLNIKDVYSGVIPRSKFNSDVSECRLLQR